MGRWASFFSQCRISMCYHGSVVTFIHCTTVNHFILHLLPFLFDWLMKRWEIVKEVLTNCNGFTTYTYYIHHTNGRMHMNMILSFRSKRSSPVESECDNPGLSNTMFTLSSDISDLVKFYLQTVPVIEGAHIYILQIFNWADDNRVMAIFINCLTKYWLVVSLVTVSIAS